MGKPSTDPGMGPSSEARLKATPPDAATEPGAVEHTKPKSQKRDTVDVLLDGFEGRETRPRILPPFGVEITPTPPPPQALLRKELTPTTPGRRKRRQGRMFLGIAVGVGVVLVLAFAAKKLMPADPVEPAPVATTAPPTVTPAPIQTEQPVITAVVTNPPMPSATTPKPKPTANPTAKPTSRDPHLVIEN